MNDWIKVLLSGLVTKARSGLGFLTLKFIKLHAFNGYGKNTDLSQSTLRLFKKCLGGR
jgi:hypothetical protein